jgi:hypothetical protein
VFLENFIHILRKFLFKWLFFIGELAWRQELFALSKELLLKFLVFDVVLGFILDGFPALYGVLMYCIVLLRTMP